MRKGEEKERREREKRKREEIERREREKRKRTREREGELQNLEVKRMIYIKKLNEEVPCWVFSTESIQKSDTSITNTTTHSIQG